MAYQDRTPEDERFEEILRLDGMNIQTFHQEQPLDLFPNAKYYPDFFNQNLVNPNRVLKQFLNDPQSNIRIFYFQLLRLAFEIPTETGYNHICLQNFKKIVFHPQFQILFTPDTEAQREIYNDFQFKKLFAQFVSLLITASESQPPSIQQAIDQFPIIDVVLIHIIRSLLVSFNIKVAFDEKIPTDLLFKQLSSVLQLSLTSYGNCWKFQQSDMFCYEDNENQIYMAFILQDFQVEDGANLQTIQSVQNQERSNYQNNLVNSNNDQSNPSNVFTHQQTMEYLHNQTDGIANLVTNDSYTLTVPNNLGDIRMRFSENDVSGNVAATNTSENQYRPYANPGVLDNQSTVISNYNYESSRNADDSRIEDMFSKIDNTLKNINNQISAPQNIQQTGNNIHSSRTQYQPPHSERTHSQNIHQQPSNYYQPPSDRRYDNNLTKSHESRNNQQNHYGSYGDSEKYQHQQFAKPSSSAQINSHSSSSYSPNVQYNSRTFESDYNKDFSPPEILAKLRPQNRENISRIKQYFQNIRRGSELPAGFSTNSNVARAISHADSRGYNKTSFEQQDNVRPYSTNLGSGNSYTSNYNQRENSFYY